jgi:hypothetical protein
MHLTHYFGAWRTNTSQMRGSRAHAVVMYYMPNANQV